MGDIGHLDEDGYLTITDRVSDMVLWGGVNIAPREIEEVLSSIRPWSTVPSSASPTSVTGSG